MSNHIVHRACMVATPPTHAVILCTNCEHPILKESWGDEWYHQSGNYFCFTMEEV